MLDGMPVIDAVIHAFNFSEANYANRYGEFLAHRISNAAASGMAGYTLGNAAEYRRDWSIEDAANIAFLESDTDLAIYHVLPIRAFKDGLCSIDKAIEARRRWPRRFLFYVGVDPMEGRAALDEMQRQYEALDGDVVGVKLYPNSWLGGEVKGWLMDDPQIAYPVFEKARSMGLKAAAVHKAVPLGPVEMLHYKVDDIDRAAIDFPELSFEIVHGGMAFVEETAWQLLRFGNVFVNLESTCQLAVTRPKAWERVMAAFMQTPATTRKIIWGTGGFNVTHPRPVLDAFQNFRFSESSLVGEGVSQISEQDKRDILAGNYARMVGLDLMARLSSIEEDEFARRRQSQEAPPKPFSTAPSIAR